MKCTHGRTKNKRLIFYAMVNYNFCVLLSFLFLVLSFSPSSAHNKIYKNCFYKIFAFGDSFTDTGNANSLGGLVSFSSALSPGSPYGSTFFKEPTNRFSDGRLVIDFLAEKFSIPYLPPYKNASADFSHGVNFAVSGSSALPNDYFLNNKVGRTLTWKVVPDCLQNQTEWFYKFLLDVDCHGKDMNACKGQMENVLFWIGEIGANDYIRNFGHAFSVESLVEMAINNVCNILKAVLDNGAKYVVVQGLPPTGCFPLDLSLSPSSDRDDIGCARSANSIVAAHNDLLQQKLAEIQIQYPDCTILYADYWNAYHKIMENPAQYGFDEPFKACCGARDEPFNFNVHAVCSTSGATTCADPSKYINWDGLHLTEAMYQKLADLFFNQGFCRPSFDELIRRKKCT